jgi:GntR family transcriptional repressor for pyruvate dehydrogenase complex
VLFGVQAIKSIATYDVAVERLRQRFHLGLVAPGSKLPPERRLAEELHVARATLREALRVLAADGYIEIRRGVSGGAVVPDHEEFLQIVLKRARGDLVARYRALEFWEITQVAAAPLAAERCTPANLKRLRLVAERVANSSDAWQRRSAEAEFCLNVGAASGNPWLANAVYDSLAATFLPFVKFTGPALEFDQASMEALIEAMEDSAPAEARRHMSLIASAYANRLRPKRRELRAAEPKEDSERVVAAAKDQSVRTV